MNEGITVLEPSKELTLIVRSERLIARLGNL